MGEFHHNIDQKGRLIIPAKFREEIGEKFIITKGFEECLFVYSESNWERVVKKINSLPFTKKVARNFQRIFLAGATENECDKQGRTNLSQHLIEHASLEKECVVIGVNDRLEIWAKIKWDNFIEDNQDSFADNAEELFEMDVDF